MQDAPLLLYCSKCSAVLPASLPPAPGSAVAAQSSSSAQQQQHQGEVPGPLPTPPCPFNGPAHAFVPVNSTTRVASVTGNSASGSSGIRNASASLATSSASAIASAAPTSSSLRQHNAAMALAAAKKGRSSGSASSQQGRNAYAIPERVDISPLTPQGADDIVEIPVVHWQSTTRAMVPLRSRPIAAALAAGASASSAAVPTATFRDFRTQVYRQFAHVLGSPTASIFSLPFGMHIDDRIPVTAANFACVMEPFLREDLEATPPVLFVFDDETAPGTHNARFVRHGVREPSVIGSGDGFIASQAVLGGGAQDESHHLHLQQQQQQQQMFQGLSASSHHSSYTAASSHAGTTTSSSYGQSSSNPTLLQSPSSSLMEQLAVRDGRRCLICRIDERLVAALVLSFDDVTSSQDLYDRFGILSLDCPQNCITLCKECRAKYDDFTFGIDPRGNVVSRRGHTWAIHGDEGNVLRLSPSDLHLHAAFPNERTLGQKYQKFLLRASQQAQTSSSAGGASAGGGISGVVSSLFFVARPEDEES